MPSCEVCGREVHSTKEVSLEGARLHVCSRCESLGQPVRKPKASLPSSPSPSSVTPTQRRSPPTTYRRPVRTEHTQRELVPVENFAQLIRKAREQRGMSQQEIAQRINERSSIIAKLEGGKMSPTIQLARKLERLFKLTLLEESETLDLSTESSSSTTTLGDIVEIRRKKTSS